MRCACVAGFSTRMRLSTIKLSGFKSFVDPTTLHLPTNMTGVVGPNGCGKSNIIDAIRWVMGEVRRQPPARRFADRRDLLRQLGAQAGEPGHRRTDLRQQRPRHHRRIRRVQRDLGQAPGQPRRPEQLLPQRHQVPPPRHHRPVPRHRPRPAQLLDHRAGHDFAGHRRQARGTARLPGGSRRHLQVQGAPQGDRDPDPPHPREPRAPQRPARGSRQAAAAPHAAGQAGRAVHRDPGRTPDQGRRMEGAGIPRAGRQAAAPARDAGAARKPACNS